MIGHRGCQRRAHARDVTYCLDVSLASRSACVTLDWRLRNSWLCDGC